MQSAFFLFPPPFELTTLSKRQLENETGSDPAQLLTFSAVLQVASLDWHHLPLLLPKLKYLHLEDTPLRSLRVLPTMASLKVLSLKNCRLRDLAGIAAFSSLTEAQFSCNLICSVSALALSPCLTAIDLSDNNITDPQELQHLCGVLRLLLDNNPVQKLPEYQLFLQRRLAKTEEVRPCQVSSEVQEQTQIRRVSEYFPLQSLRQVIKLCGRQEQSLVIQADEGSRGLDQYLQALETIRPSIPTLIFNDFEDKVIEETKVPNSTVYYSTKMMEREKRREGKQNLLPTRSQNNIGGVSSPGKKHLSLDPKRLRLSERNRSFKEVPVMNEGKKPLEDYLRGSKARLQGQPTRQGRNLKSAGGSEPIPKRSLKQKLQLSKLLGQVQQPHRMALQSNFYVSGL